MVRFRLFGIPVEIQPWFWIIMALLSGRADMAGSAEGLLYLAIFMLAGTISILVHELGHALVGKSFGAPTAITLHGMGGFASFPTARFSRKQDFAVTAAGPVAQILLGLGARAIGMFANLPTPTAKLFVSDLAFISIFWAVLNLLPVIPLDGGRLVLATLGPRRQKISLWISIIAAAVAAITMLILTGGFSLFALYLGFFGFESWKALQEIKRRGF